MNKRTETSSIVLRADKVVTQKTIGTQKVKYKNPRISIDSKILAPLKPDHLRIEIVYVGICGTDVHLIQSDSDGFILTSAPLDIPLDGRLIGHEGVGKVISIGADVNRFKLDDYVALESIITCKTCEPCRRGNFNQCENAKLVGMQTNGIFSTIVDIPESIAHNVNSLSNKEDGLKAAACLEPAGVAWLACNNSTIQAGESILIFGGGPIGYFCAMIAKLIFGASHISLVEPVLFRRIHAKKWCDDIHEAIDDDVLKKSYDVIIEASGFLKNLPPIIDRIKPNGRLALLARSGESITIDGVDHIITNNIKIFGVRGHLGGAFGRIINLCQAGRLPIHEAVTNVLSSIENLQETLINPTNILTKNCKVLVKIN